MTSEDDPFKIEDMFCWLSGTELGSTGAKKLLCGIWEIGAALSL